LYYRKEIDGLRAIAVLDTYPEPPNIDPTNKIADLSQSLITKNVREAYWQSLKTIITRLLNSGKKVYILYPIPELPIHISKAIHPSSIFGNNSFIDLLNNIKLTC